MSITEERLLLSYRFAVVFVSGYLFDIRFQKVSGLTVSIGTETLREGGENVLTHHLPTHSKYENLVLEKGRMAGGVSILFNAQLSAMFSGFAFHTADIMVVSLNENNIPVSDFDASANSVLIDRLELAYRGLVKLVYRKIMPVQVLELVIKATIESEKQQINSTIKNKGHQEELIEECVNRVLKRLEEQGER